MQQLPRTACTICCLSKLLLIADYPIHIDRRREERIQKLHLPFLQALPLRRMRCSFSEAPEGLPASGELLYPFQTYRKSDSVLADIVAQVSRYVALCGPQPS